MPVAPVTNIRYVQDRYESNPSTQSLVTSSNADLYEPGEEVNCCGELVACLPPFPLNIRDAFGGYIVFFLEDISRRYKI